MQLLKRKPRLLVLDDDTTMQKLVSKLLERRGYRVDVVSSGSQALEMIEKHVYEALLLDVMTPTDGGITVIRRLRDERPELLKRIVLVTASPDSVLRSVEGEIFGIVRKPFVADELSDTIARVVGQ